VKITTIVVKRFREWLEEQIRRINIDPAVLGLTELTDENVKAFLEEHCKDLTYEECKDKVLEMYPVLKYAKPVDVEALALAQQELTEYYNTPYVSEAFKEFCKRHNYDEIREMLIDIKGTELEIFLDFVKARYGAEDVDVRMFNELPVYGIRTQTITKGREQLFLTQMIRYQGYKPAKTIFQLIAHGEDLRVAHSDTRALILIAIISDEENVILPVTQSIPECYMVVLNNANKRGALIY